jgi:hypothetical protein
VRAGWFVFVGLVAGFGCDTPHVQTCGQIPDGGCPIGRGGTCDDPTCAALYDCLDGEWKLSEECEASSSDATTSATTTGGDGGGCDNVPMFDRTDEADGCTPDLEPPDCPAEAAETCSPCSTGCVDFYICKTAGWDDVAYCDDLGALVVIDGR